VSQENNNNAVEHGDDPEARALPSWFYIMIVLMILIAVFSIWHGQKFADRTNFQNIALDASQLMLLAIGSTFVIITAGIDLSVNAMLVLSAICSAKLMAGLAGTPAEVRRGEYPHQDLAITVGLFAAVLVGLFLGFVNGMLITKLKLPPFIVTLGTLGIMLGVANILSEGSSVRFVPYEIVTLVGSRKMYLPDAITDPFGIGRIGGVPLLVCVAAIVVIAASITLRFTRFGRYTFAIGSNPAAARRAGINVDLHLIKVYALSGLLAGVAGAMDVARFGTANSSAHSTDNLNAISAVVIGGTSLFGGMGSIIGTVIGAFIPAILRNGLIIGGITSFYQQVLVGSILIIAVYMDQRRRKAEERM
jgi:ribose transport system permease protein